MTRDSAQQTISVSQEHQGYKKLSPVLSIYHNLPFIFFRSRNNMVSAASRPAKQQLLSGDGLFVLDSNFI